MELEIDTRVTPIPEEPGRFRAEVSKAWDVHSPQGGYLAAIALRAAADASHLVRPVSFGCHFLWPAQHGRAEVGVEILQKGRRAESFQISLVQEGALLLRGWLRTAAVGDGPEHAADTAPAVPGPRDLASRAFLEGASSFWERIEMRPAQPERATSQDRAQEPQWLEWLRLRSWEESADPILAACRQLVLLDSMWDQASMAPHPGIPWRSTGLELSVRFHRPEARGDWLLSETRSPVATLGLLGVDGRLWDEAGRLMASGGAQLSWVGG